MALTLVTGADVVVQRLIKLDPEFAILRGRMAGTQDIGRVVVIPYAHLVTVNLTRPLSDTDLEAIFGKNGQAFAGEIVLSGPVNETAALGHGPLEEEPERDIRSEPQKKPAGGAKPAMPSKTQLLAKLRARLNDPSRPGGGSSA
jgi:hypothetical protein